MAYFPAFLKFDDKKIIIVGGGAVALEKLEHLLDFSKDIELIAKDFSVEIMELVSKYKLKATQKSYCNGDILGFDIIIAAIDCFSLQEEIYKESRTFSCLCNCVDLPKYCDFIFPSYVKKGDLTIAVSTSGTSPAMAKHLRIYLEKMIPSSIVDFLKQMKSYRKTMPKGKERMDFLDKKAENYIKTWKEN